MFHNIGLILYLYKGSSLSLCLIYTNMKFKKLKITLKKSFTVNTVSNFLYYRIHEIVL